MKRNIFLNRPWLIIALSFIFVAHSANAFAGGRGRSHHETIIVGHDRYHYHDGRFYRPSWFWFEIAIAAAPIGAIVTALPFGYRTIIVRGIPYYYSDGIYYRPCSFGYIVVPEPSATTNVVYMPSAAQSQESDRETVTINIPNSNGGYTAITLIRYPNGFVGPQGEFYPNLPTAEQLRARYGK